MNKQKRKELTAFLKSQRVRIWFKKVDEVTRESWDHFLKVEDLGDKEIARINSALFWGVTSGSVFIKSERSVALNWES